LYQKVTEDSERINLKYSRNAWRPIIHVRRSLDRPRLMGLFRAADFAMVSSLFDGMNLVAKEFISAQVDNHGVLLLSETAGAANELEEAFNFNPLDAGNFAEQLHQALTTPLAERSRRIQVMREQIHRHTIYDWMNHIVSALEAVAKDYASR